MVPRALFYFLMALFSFIRIWDEARGRDQGIRNEEWRTGYGYWVWEIVVRIWRLGFRIWALGWRWAIRICG